MPDIDHCFEICSFWVAIAHPLYPVKLNITNSPADGYVNVISFLVNNFNS